MLVIVNTFNKCKKTIDYIDLLIAKITKNQ